MNLLNCLILAFLLFGIGVWGLMRRRHLIGMLISIELMLHKSGKILVSDYGMYTYESFLDQAFLSRLREETKENEHWEVRTFQMNIYTCASQVLSYIHSLPLHLFLQLAS